MRYNHAMPAPVIRALTPADTGAAHDLVRRVRGRRAGRRDGARVRPGRRAPPPRLRPARAPAERRRLRARPAAGAAGGRRGADHRGGLPGQLQGAGGAGEDGLTALPRLRGRAPRLLRDPRGPPQELGHLRANPRAPPAAPVIPHTVGHGRLHVSLTSRRLPSSPTLSRIPPSMGISVPLRNPARSEARNAMRWATSAVSPSRRAGVMATAPSRISAGMAVTRGVAIRPGRIALQVIPSRAYSSVTVLVNPRMPTRPAR